MPTKRHASAGVATDAVMRNTAGPAATNLKTIDFSWNPRARLFADAAKGYGRLKVKTRDFR